MHEVKVPLVQADGFASYLERQGISHSVIRTTVNAIFKSAVSLKMYWHTYRRMRIFR